ncbi:uncharacterized protein N7483_000109 [Penicillium malachiteum]|uniref:uncharacterized protein n=1 Tax=Penicillium malachiteum TaxID=1324776 RepID=UPI0025485B4A|nr:uncharacterized protein N7483_000109 [Penicillium malachiteum]KAJ5734984.1 hypothetical protein N7483_000109 [Penicillium malachiteum]
MSESDYEDPPPLYIKVQNTSMPVHETLVPPSHSEAESLNVLENATRKFPLTTMKGYFKRNNKDTQAPSAFELGTTENNSRLFAVSTSSNEFTNSLSVTLHDGATHEASILATLTANEWGLRGTKPCLFHLPVRPGSLYKREIVKRMIPRSKKFTARKPIWNFSALITSKDGTQDVEEIFEWRSSGGKEVEEIATGYRYGWKLVRVSGPNSGSGGPRKKRDFGFTSDGLDIVAVATHNPSRCMDKALRFSFMRTGLTGELGEGWEIMAVVSALQLWYWRAQEIAARRAAAQRAARKDDWVDDLLLMSMLTSASLTYW